MAAKVEFHLGELFSRVRFYNKRGNAEQWIEVGKQPVKMTRLSCHRFRSNEVRPWLSVMAYNVGKRRWRLVLPKEIENLGTWSGGRCSGAGERIAAGR